MTVRVTSTYVREDANKKWYWETDDGKAGIAAFNAYKKTNFIDNGKKDEITQTLSEDELTLTVVRLYDSTDDLEEFNAVSTVVARVKLLSDYNASNDITYTKVSVEEV